MFFAPKDILQKIPLRGFFQKDNLIFPFFSLSQQNERKWRDFKLPPTFAPKSSYGEIFFISRLELVDKILTPKIKKKMGVTDFVSEKMAVEKCLNFDKSVIITR